MLQNSNKQFECKALEIKNSCKNYLDNNITSILSKATINKLKDDPFAWRYFFCHLFQLLNKYQFRDCEFESKYFLINVKKLITLIFFPLRKNMSVFKVADFLSN